MTLRRIITVKLLASLIEISPSQRQEASNDSLTARIICNRTSSDHQPQADWHCQICLDNNSRHKWFRDPKTSSVLKVSVSLT